MHSPLKTTTASAALAAALSLSPVLLVAQEATANDAVAPDAAADPAATGETIAADETSTAPAAGEAATDNTMMAEEGAASEGAVTEGAQTEMASDDTVAATGDGTMTAEAGDGLIIEPVVTADAGAVATPPETPNADMQAVLDKLAALGAQPIETLTVEEARTQPTPADAVAAVMEERGIEMPVDLAAIATRDVTYPGADGSDQPARVYTPVGEGPFPLILYIHGGGWVIADIDTYDASARALAAGAQAVVVSIHYRQAPENPFRAAHDDANAAFAHFVETSGEINADSERLAVAGESAGGNLAVNVAIHARDAGLTPVDHMLVVYPIADDSMATPSYEAYAEAAPLSRAGMMWFAEHVFADPTQAADPRIDLIDRGDLAGLPPATFVMAEIDPLQSEGEILAERLAAAGVEVEAMTYPGVAHEFFGMGAVVPEAKEAMGMATAALREAFADTTEPMAAEGTEPAATEAAEPMAADAASPTEGAAGEVTAVEPTAAETPEAMEADPMAEEPAAMDDAMATGDGSMENEETGTATDQ